MRRWLGLAERGRLHAGRRQTVRSGKPLSGATINRYVSTLGSVYKFARRARLVPRTFVAPTRGIEKHTEEVDPDRYLRQDEVERIIVCARIVDRHWRRLPAIVVLAFHTGLRMGSLKKLKWENVDLSARRLVLGRTKNGSPIGSALTARCVEELDHLLGKEPAALVFGNRYGRPFHFKRATDATAKRNADAARRYINQAPKSQRLTLSRALTGTASPRQAIRAKCLDCCGFDRNEVRNCPAVRCPLHGYRPFQKSSDTDA